MLTPAEKRAATMEKLYGPDWRKKRGQLAKEARELIHGKEQYSQAGKKGGASKAIKAPESYAFQNKGLASEAGKKGAEKRWGKKQNEKI